MIAQNIQIKAPLQIVYGCVTDFESYPKFLSEMKEAKIAWCEDKEMEVRFRINLLKDISYTLLFELDPPREIHWKLKAGEWMKSNCGSWILKPLGDALTEVRYSIDIGFSLWVPKAITQALVEKNLPLTLKAFKKRAEKMFQSQCR